MDCKDANPEPATVGAITLVGWYLFANFHEQVSIEKHLIGCEIEFVHPFWESGIKAFELDIPLLHTHCALSFL
jgi:hypothetical protein